MRLTDRTLGVRELGRVLKHYIIYTLCFYAICLSASIPLRRSLSASLFLCIYRRVDIA